MRVLFDNAWVLYFLWTVPALVAWWVVIHGRCVRGMAAFVSPELQSKLFPRAGTRRQLWQIGLAGTALLLLLGSMARPKWGEQEETVYQRARDLVIAVDVSRSMLANDVHPSRLRRAKIDLIDLIEELRGDRAALIAFRAKPALVCPLTTDYAFLRQALDGISPSSAPRGETDIGGAIAKALDAFDEDDPSHKAVILISDGEDLTGRAKEISTEAGSRQIPIYTIGIGSRSGSRIPDSEKKARYLRHKDKDIVTKLDHETLYAIAKASGGSYIPVETASMTSTTLGTLYRDHLRKIDARELAETREKRAIERYQLFLFPAICLLLFASCLSRGRLARTTSPLPPQEESPLPPHQALPDTDLKDLTPPKRELKQIGIILFLALSTCALSAEQVPQATPSTAPQLSTNSTEDVSTVDTPEDLPAGRLAARKAQRLFRQGKYREAAETYLRAAQGVSRRANRDFRHNAAVALAKAGDFKESAHLFRELSLQGRRGETDENVALGGALFRAAAQCDNEDPDKAQERARLLRDAAEAFKEAWRTDGEDSQARDNVAITMQQLAEAEEQATTLALAAKYGNVPAPQLADEMLAEQRKIARELPAAITNTSPERIYQLEQLAERQKELSDMWRPLRGKLVEAMSQQGNASNAQHFAALTQLMDVTREEMLSGAQKLRDLDAEGFRSSKLAEHGTYQLWKTVAPFDMLLREDLRQQTNVIAMAEGTKPADQYTSPEDIQNEAAQLTELFKARFEATVPEEGTAQAVPPESSDDGAQADQTMQQKQGITAEDRAKIVELASQAIEGQKLAADHIGSGRAQSAIEHQKAARDKLTAIQQLLPKQQQQQNQEQQQQDQQQQEQQQQQQQQQDESQDQEQQEQQQEQRPQEEPEQKDIRDLLQKALEREREHEAEKRRRHELIPRPSFERDW